MALTNYMIQVVVLDVLASGYGIGLRLRPLDYVIAALLLFGTEACISQAWSARFRSGPLDSPEAEDQHHATPDRHPLQSTLCHRVTATDRLRRRAGPAGRQPERAARTVAPRGPNDGRRSWPRGGSGWAAAHYCIGWVGGRPTASLEAATAS